MKIYSEAHEPRRDADNVNLHYRLRLHHLLLRFLQGHGHQLRLEPRVLDPGIIKGDESRDFLDLPDNAGLVGLLRDVNPLDALWTFAPAYGRPECKLVLDHQDAAQPPLPHLQQMC